jgi:hypothetical protein
VHEVAKAAPVALAIFILPTARLSKVGDRGKFSIEWTTCADSELVSVQLMDTFEFTYLHTTCCLDYPPRSGLPSPTRNERTHSQSDGLPHYHIPSKKFTLAPWGVNCRYSNLLHTWSSRRWPNFASSQYKSSYTASNPSWSCCSVSEQTGSCAGLW